jgi:DivIVA domain-containing protein
MNEKGKIMDQRVITEKEILEKKFTASKNGYNPFEVDKFLDTIILSVIELNRQIILLQQEKSDSKNTIQILTRQLNDLKSEFQLFKNRFKNIKEDDVLNNRSNFELLKKVNVYERKLSELGVDVSKL